MTFEEQIHKWIQLDNHMKLLNEKITHLREIKNNLMPKIMSHVEEHNLSKSTFQLNNDKLKFGNNKIPQPITFTYLEKCLKDIIKNENQVKQIIDYIKQKREVKNNFEIKRF
jgi:hypothetical protein